jgi:enoyl reductase-like protein
MMSSLAFDSLKFARRLKEAGVPEAQAEAQAELMAETFGYYVDNLVTRDYLDAVLDARFAEQDARIEARFREQDARIEARFSQQDLFLEQRLSRVDTKLNVMAALLALIAASVIPLSLGTLLAG